MIDWRWVVLVLMGALFIAALAVPVSWFRAAWYWLLDRAFRGWAMYYLEQETHSRILAVDPNNRYLFLMPDVPPDVADDFVASMRKSLGDDVRVSVVFSDSITIMELDRGKRPTIRG